MSNYKKQIKESLVSEILIAYKKVSAERCVDQAIKKLNLQVKGEDREEYIRWAEKLLQEKI